MLFVSDVHGALPAMEKALSWFEKLGCRHLILLGDLLNHGPRNPIPAGYDPSSVSERLNSYGERIVAVRGNCDGEVDQMLCAFPLMADYNWLIHDGFRLFLTHGHLYGPDRLPPLAEGDGYAYGHTHIPLARRQDGRVLFNPGSITFPKNGYLPSFGYFDGRELMVRTLADGEVMERVRWGKPDVQES